ncbi:MAG: tRNA (guanosine(46)-N7)-methyltransferase TrmB [Cyclobacteriaceae bacterium]
MSRQKTKKFEANKLRKNILEPGKEIYEKISGDWNSLIFKNDRPITLELGCGRGEYSIGLASLFPDKNFIGVDIKGDRLYIGSTMAIEQDLPNVAFLRTQMQWLSKFFNQGEVDEIWLTFPDPRPKDRDEKRRLTYPMYMNLYKEVLKKDGWFRFKTDNTALFEYTLALFTAGKVVVTDLDYTFDLYNSSMVSEHFGIKTKYEGIWTAKGEKIKYMKFRFK